MIKDPFKREILAAGYTNAVIFHRPQGDQLLLMRESEVIKRIDAKKYYNFLFSLTIKVGVLPDGEHYVFISERDGSAEKYREYIKKD